MNYHIALLNAKYSRVTVREDSYIARNIAYPSISGLVLRNAHGTL